MVELRSANVHSTGAVEWGSVLVAPDHVVLVRPYKNPALEGYGPLCEVYLVAGPTLIVAGTLNGVSDALAIRTAAPKEEPFEPIVQPDRSERLW